MIVIRAINDASERCTRSGFLLGHSDYCLTGLAVKLIKVELYFLSMRKLAS